MVSVSENKDVLLLSSGLLAFGGVVGLFVGSKVGVLSLPQTVAAFHSLVGLAAMSTSIGSFLSSGISSVSYSPQIHSDRGPSSSPRATVG